MHSNGNPIGITALEENIGFCGITKLNMIAPDKGSGDRYVGRDRLEKISFRQHFTNIEVYANRGDVVPLLGTVNLRSSLDPAMIQ